MLETVSSKYTFICDPDECDCLIELTSSDRFGFPSGVTELTCPCGRDTTLLSVVHATIAPSTQTKEEQTMETTIAPQTMTLTWQNNGIDETTTYTENDVRSAIYNNKRYAEKMNEYYRKESQLRTLLEEVYADSNEQDTLSQIAEIFDVPLTKEIEVTAWVRVDMTIEVDMANGDYDIEDMVRNNLTIDCFGSAISINDYDVERVEEGAY